MWVLFQAKFQRRLRGSIAQNDGRDRVAAQTFVRIHCNAYATAREDEVNVGIERNPGRKSVVPAWTFKGIRLDGRKCPTIRTASADFYGVRRCQDQDCHPARPPAAQSGKARDY